MAVKPLLLVSLTLPSFSNVYHFACVWPTALKLGCITNLDTFFLVMGFISLVDEIQFMLISSRHICIRSMQKNIKEASADEREVFLIMSKRFGFK